MAGVIDLEALNQDEMSPDAYALAEVIKQLSPLLQESFDLYSDVRKKLVAQFVKKPQLSFESTVVADVAPTDNVSIQPDGNFDKLRKAMIALKSHLQQLEGERKGSIAAAANALAQYKAENERLYQQLAAYRMKEAMESDTTTEYSQSPASSATSSISGTRRGASEIPISPAYKSSRATPRKGTPSRSSVMKD